MSQEYQLEKAVALLQDPKYKGSIDSISIPLDIATPDWVIDLVDYKSIISDNLSGFPFDSIGIVKYSDKINYSNILQL
jgi:hypothetical protein